MANSNNHVNNTQEFMEQIKNITLEEGECITQNDATELFTSIPVEPALNIIKKKLEQDSNSTREPACPLVTSLNYMDSVCTTPVSCLKASSMTLFKVQPWSHMSAPLWKTFTRKILNAEP